MIRFTHSALALALTFAASTALAAQSDSDFFKKAAEGGMAEVELGRLAQDKSSNASVKEFGGMMVMDHTAANDKLKALAARKNVKLPDSPSAMQKASKAKLELLTGDTFDKSYIKGMVKDHEDDIKLFENEASSGQDADVKAFASQTLPTLKSHLTKIQAIASAQGVKTK